VCVMVEVLIVEEVEVVCECFVVVVEIVLVS